ncbi:MerR family transcriptional regulator [Nocardioides sp. dk4132]|uniref:MerR family transcriptional regulator n=1 Tax=unclassified Nocardioides TaxID=2615069 RepID=UPI0012957D44|nr:MULTISPECIES: MerR family transcriptional regulator [unclassified Nocardioides]MQW75328.1 MerR family transcriptional regulator [Nocardioides sp. dk4132]QGA07523.1 MerR family transcriptional regulator [Nocardioides sp. dk884]
MTTTQAGDRRRGVFAISVAADMVSMRIQNLRVYERRGLVAPDRTPGGSRLYSPDDIERLHRIRELLGEGLNLAGVARVLALEERVRVLEERVRQRDAAHRD